MKHVEVVCALIQREDGKIFCCKRGPGRALANKWEFPGGKIEQDETKEEAIVREIKEELKSDIAVIKYIGVSNHDYVDLENPFSITMYAYLCKLIKGNLELTEHIDSCYASVEEMKLMDFAAADIFLIDILNK
ncbi:MAG: (deoxy)nucleoside triphosphate pyrophosphohydrolase [Acholeplasmatales bacterium]|jgi:8-oxo-dGTP diphosphatase|nr:(deoxy)nucleoside triphosphate pyrophosphohydrolase [Acholeplasmatales bacterium]